MSEHIDPLTCSKKERSPQAVFSRYGKAALVALIGLGVATGAYEGLEAAAHALRASQSGAITSGLKAACPGDVIPTDNQGDSACYFWAGAYQNHNGSFSAKGISAHFTQDNPIVQNNGSLVGNHSLIELYAASADGRQAIEAG